MSLLLVGCAASAALPAPALRAAPKVKPKPPPPKPREPSPYERKWLAACADEGTLGECPAPFDRPAVFVDVEGKGEYQPPAMCKNAADPAGESVRAALAKKRKALKACLRSAPGGAWVDLELGGGKAKQGSPELPARALACVAKQVEQALPDVTKTPAKRVVVMKGGSTREDAEALSKESVDQVILSHTDEVGVCYDGALEVWPGLAGRMASTFVIWFDGSVALVHTQESSLENPALECCINSAVRAWRFGQPADGAIVLVTFPFVLGSKPQD